MALRLDPWRSAGCYLMVGTAAFGWLLGGATWALVTNTQPTPLLFTGPLIAWMVFGAFGTVIWIAVRLIRKGG